MQWRKQLPSRFAIGHWQEQWKNERVPISIASHHRGNSRISFIANPSQFNRHNE
jgi:hypothetical protein